MTSYIWLNEVVAATSSSAFFSLKNRSSFAVTLAASAASAASFSFVISSWAAETFSFLSWTAKYLSNQCAR